VDGRAVREPNFAVTVESEEGRKVVRVRGDVDVATAPQLKRVLDHAQAASRQDVRSYPVVVKLSGVTFIDACGLGVLTGAALRARRTGSELVLRDVPRRVMQLIEITRLASAFRLERSDHRRSIVTVPSSRPSLEVA
jgi:anti-sigma B factor antagonist